MTQDEFDQWCEEHGKPWVLIAYAKPDDVRLAQREREDV